MNKTRNLILLILAILFLSSGFLVYSVNAEDAPYQTPAKDSDFDGLTDQIEIDVYKSDPENSDTDGDGFLDSAEILAGTSPLQADIAPPLTHDSVEQSSLLHWPWYVTRASAITAYLLLFLLIVSGASIKTSDAFRLISPTTAWINHRLIGIALTFFVFVHIVALLFDKFLKFTLVDILVPFASSFKPLYLALGIIGFYILLVIIISSIFFIDKYQKKWRLLHYLSYPLFVLICIHGFYTGTDSASPTMRIVYFGTGLIVALLVIYRLFFYYKQTDWKKFFKKD